MNIIDLLLVITECYLLVETFKSAREAYLEYLDTITRTPLTPLNTPSTELTPVIDGKECKNLPVDPTGQGPFLFGMFLINIKDVTPNAKISSGCYEFTPVFYNYRIRSEANPLNILSTAIAAQWSTPNTDYTGGKAIGVTHWRVRPIDAVSAMTGMDFTTDSIVNVVYFYYQ